MIPCMPELPVLSWWFLESHRSLLFTQLFAILPNHNVLGTKYALGFQAAVSVIYCQRAFECTQGSVGQSWGTRRAGLSPHLPGSFGTHSPRGHRVFYPLCCSWWGRGSISEPRYWMCRDLGPPGITTAWFALCFSSVLHLEVCPCAPLDPLHPAWKEHLQVPCKLLRVFTDTKPKK